MSIIPIINDEPTLIDKIGWNNHIRIIGDHIKNCAPPMVFGIHGDWGSGKTSFLKQLQAYYTGENPFYDKTEIEQEFKKLYGDSWSPEEELTVIWFDAWRYQFESAPIVALLNEIRAQLPFRSKAIRSISKYASISTRSALLSLEDLTKKIGFQASKIEDSGEKWERETLSYTLPSDTIRKYLESTLKSLIGKKKEAKLIIFIDDLDRCDAECAYRLLEGIKIYLNLSNCIFVLGMNLKTIDEALTRVLKLKKDDQQDKSRSKDYLEKLCQVVWHIPLVISTYDLLKQWIPETFEDHAILYDIVKKYACLPGNPRKIKAFSNNFARFVETINYVEVKGNAPNPIRNVKLLVVVVYIYVFFNELYRRLEENPNFIESIVNWASGFHSDQEITKVFQGFNLLQSPIITDDAEKEAIPKIELIHNFPDPSESNVFRVQKLLIDINKESPILSGEIQKYLIRI